MGQRQRVLGIDLGIASCGWAVIEVADREGAIIAAGVRCFDAPLVDKTGEPKSAQRRTARGQRRVIRRRRQRMNAVRKLFCACGLLPDAKDDALAQALRRISPAKQRPQVTPWMLRAAGQDRALSKDEFAVVLGHIARHRGFRSNSKRDANPNPEDETSKMKKAMEQTREGLAKYRSFGEMLADDPKFASRKRNRDKDYSHTAKRSDLQDELRTLFAAQRRLNNQLATAELEGKFAPLAFDQRPLQDSEDKVGPCPFERGERRTAKRAPSFEQFRFLQRLVNLRIAVGRTERPLTLEEIGLVVGKFGQQKSYSYKTLRKDLDLDPNARFSAIARKSENLDIAARKGQSAYGTCVLRDVLGGAPWQSLLKIALRISRHDGDVRWLKGRVGHDGVRKIVEVRRQHRIRIAGDVRLKGMLEAKRVADLVQQGVPAMSADVVRRDAAWDEITVGKARLAGVGKHDGGMLNAIVGVVVVRTPADARSEARKVGIAEFELRTARSRFHKRDLRERTDIGERVARRLRFSRGEGGEVRVRDVRWLSGWKPVGDRDGGADRRAGAPASEGLRCQKIIDVKRCCHWSPPMPCLAKRRRSRSASRLHFRTMARKDSRPSRANVTRSSTIWQNRASPAACRPESARMAVRDALLGPEA
jgi:hypothetical protein